MIFFGVLLLLVLGYLIIKIAVPIYRVHRMMKKMRSEMENMYGAMGADGQEPEDEYSAQPKKKIDPEVGEYVDFEDLPADPVEATNTATESSRPMRTESQIEDAEWEEI